MPQKDEATDVADAEPYKFDVDVPTPTDGPKPGDNPPKDDPPPKGDKPEDNEKSDKWNPDRQKFDETVARTKKNADALGAIQSTVESLSDKLMTQVAQMVADKGGGQEPPAENADDLMQQIEALGDDADFGDLTKALKAVAKSLKSGSGNKTEVEKALQELRDKDAARDSREAQQSSRQAVSNHLAELERTYFDGKRTHRSDIVKGAQELVAKMGFDKENPPPKSTGLLALEAVAEKIAAKEQATQKEKDNQVVPDSMSSGRPVEWGDADLTMEEAVAKMTTEGKL